MTFEEYHKETAMSNTNLGSTFTNSTHMVLGMVTEAAELADVYKKHMAYNKPIDMPNVKEELGDMFWYLSEFMRINGIDPAEVFAINNAKLKARYGDKFSEENAINRNLEKEREILERGIKGGK